MRAWQLLASLAVGILLGAGGIWIISGGLSAHVPLASSGASDRERARAAMGGIADLFAKIAFTSDGAGEFHMPPRAFGRSMCSVDIINVPGRMVGASPGTPRFQEITLFSAYGFWRDPANSGGENPKACTGFRDFEHLIEAENGGAVERAVTYLADASVLARRAGPLPFVVACDSVRTGEPATCDGRAMLARFAYRDIAQVETMGFASNSDSSSYSDLALTLGIDGKVIAYTIDSVVPFEGADSVRNIKKISIHLDEVD